MKTTLKTNSFGITKLELSQTFKGAPLRLVIEADARNTVAECRPTVAFDPYR